MPIPLKNTPCVGGCGIVVQYRTNPKVLCADCRVSRKAEQARLGMEKQRRKRGVPSVKGVERACEACGTTIVLNRNLHTRFCGSCSLEASRARARESSKRKIATKEGREYLNAWQREQTATCPAYRLAAHMRVLMHRALGSQKAGRSWRSLVPYTLPELMRHLERQFLPGMTWANKGDWHVDHVRPLTSFKISSPQDPDFSAAWALSNLRPLWAVDNIRKNARRTHLL